MIMFIMNKQPEALQFLDKTDPIASASDSIEPYKVRIICHLPPPSYSPFWDSFGVHGNYSGVRDLYEQMHLKFHMSQKANLNGNNWGEGTTGGGYMVFSLLYHVFWDGWSAFLLWL